MELNGQLHVSAILLLSKEYPKYYELNMRLGGPHDRSGCFRDEKYFAPVMNQTMIPRSLAFSLVTIPTMIYFPLYGRYLVRFFAGFQAILSGNFVVFLSLSHGC